MHAGVNQGAADNGFDSMHSKSSSEAIRLNFSTADLSDANPGKVQIVLPGLSNFGGESRFYGEMVTLKAWNDFSQVRELVKSPGTGKVLVIDNAGAMHCAVLGDLLAAAACENGWRAVVVNGCIRDSAEIAGMQLGVRALAAIPARGDNLGRGDVGLELNFLGAVFRPGEYLYGDADGILLSPSPLH